MAQQTIKFSIKQDGTVTEEVIGIVGDACQNLTKNIEEKLGTVTNTEHKAEFYQKNVATIQQEEIIEEFTHDSEGC